MAARRNFGSNWWARRWLDVLESFGWASRLQRGRTYARRGNVLSIELAPGMVNAKVQGSRPRPYNVMIKITPLSDAEWNRVIEVLASKAAFAARLLAGEMPEDIETAFTGVSLSLFPCAAREIVTSCSCPDWANPCKHIAAVYYLLGEKFDSDPFLLFLLRGREKEAIIRALREKRAALAGGGPSLPVKEEEKMEPVAEESSSPPELPADPVDFWQVGEALAAFQVSMHPPAVPRGVLKRLGPPPFGRHAQDFYQLLNSYYREISRRAYELAYDAGDDGSQV
ncbi:SWIM zinc finger family protein [Neomoorella carbonis]|uniref:SWIM zinc finger family protein n=1 Tax=Neomoorella carbonis TaxID=3062783 RepID=UPI0032505E6D